MNANGVAPAGAVQARLRLAAVVCAAAAGAVGMLALVGWAAAIPVLRTGLPGLASMKANTALVFVFGGVSLALHAHRSGWRLWLARVAAGLCGALGAITLLEFGLGLSTGIDTLLFREAALAEAAAIPGRMSPLTAVCAVLVAMGLLAIGREVAQWLGAAVFLSGLLALLGYLDAAVFGSVGIESYTSLSMNTAVAYTLLAGGLVMARPEIGLLAALIGTGPASMLTRALLPTAAGLPILAGWALLEGYREDLYGFEVAVALIVLVTTLGLGAVLRVATAQVERAEEERRRLERSLQRAQRMEAVGKLAAGVAHDFNNVLTAIAVSAELVSAAMPEDDERQADARTILDSANSASGLTRQLLAFTSRQATQKRPLDLNEVIEGMVPMLRRTLRSNVAFRLDLDRDVGLVDGDATQLEQVVLNLVVNASDAMPDGGSLVVGTSSAELDAAMSTVEPTPKRGQYVLLTVSDTGFGMDEETRSHIFEPFYTTKAEGKGTGLGLSTVYGIVRQSDGYVWPYSEPGGGTVMKVYLPRSGSSAPSVAVPRRKAGATDRPTETVLVVDDDDGVRKATTHLLTKLGYRTLQANGATEAIEVAERHRSAIDLVLLDVVLPRLGGQELASLLQKRHRSLKVLFMSGYSDEAARGLGVPEAATFLPKPFTADDLSRRIAEVLRSEVDDRSA